MEIPLSTEMKKERWRTFVHMLRLHHQIQKDILEEKGVLYLFKLTEIQKKLNKTTTY